MREIIANGTNLAKLRFGPWRMGVWKFHFWSGRRYSPVAKWTEAIHQAF